MKTALILSLALLIPITSINAISNATFLALSVPTICALSAFNENGEFVDKKDKSKNILSSAVLAIFFTCCAKCIADNAYANNDMFERTVIACVAGLYSYWAYSSAEKCVHEIVNNK